MNGFPAYSPDGSRLAFDIIGGDVGVLTFATGEVRQVGRDLIAQPGHSYSSPAWIQTNELTVANHWLAEERPTESKQDSQGVQINLVWSVVNVAGWQAAASGDESCADCDYSSCDVDGLRIRWDRPAGIATLLKANGTRAGPLISVDFGTIVGVASPWIVVSAEAKTVEYGAPINLTRIDARTGSKIVIPGYPRPSPFGVLVTHDGRWLFSANYVDDKWKPIVFDTAETRFVELPDGTHWAPVSLSEPRGVLLVVNYNPADSGHDRVWMEVPLEEIIRIDGDRRLRRLRGAPRRVRYPSLLAEPTVNGTTALTCPAVAVETAGMSTRLHRAADVSIGR